LSDDEQLLKRCARGDDDALSAAIARWREPVLRLALRVLRDPAAADDAAAETFVKLWSRGEGFDGRCPAEVWVRRVAWHAILDVRRRRKRWWNRLFLRSAESSQDEPADRRMEVDEANESDRRRLNAAIAELDDGDRALVQFHYYEGRPLAEIAEVFEVSRDAIKMRLSRVRGKLRKLLEPSE